jgi:hypothetical protein
VAYLTRSAAPAATSNAPSHEYSFTEVAELISEEAQFLPDVVDVLVVALEPLAAPGASYVSQS